MGGTTLTTPRHTLNEHVALVKQGILCHCDADVSIWERDAYELARFQALAGTTAGVNDVEVEKEVPNRGARDSAE